MVSRPEARRSGDHCDNLHEDLPGAVLYKSDIVDNIHGSFLSAQSPKEKVSKGVSGPLGRWGPKSQKTIEN